MVIILIGLMFGIFILLPLSEFATYLEYYRNENTLGPVEFIGKKLNNTLTFKHPLRFIYYGGFGILSGLLFLFIYNYLRRKQGDILRLQEELQQGLLPLILQGESQSLEFKSSFRYDLKSKSVNKALENVIMKTLAGFMNTEGGTLLIGVSDEGSILGLDMDYQTLKRKDNDGFEQLIMNTVSQRLGTSSLKYIRVIFHKHEHKEVCRLIVSKSAFPVYVKDGNNKKFYVRTGSGTREMDIQEAITYISHHW